METPMARSLSQCGCDSVDWDLVNWDLVDWDLEDSLSDILGPILEWLGVF